MTFKITALIIALSALLISFSQDIEITNKATVNWGQEFKAKKAFYSDVLLTKNNKIYLYKSEVKGLSNLKPSIEVLDKTLNPVKNFEINFDHSSEDLLQEGIFAFNDHFIILGSNRVKKEKTNTLYYATLDIKTGKQSEFKEIGVINFFQNRNAGNFSYDVSPDSSKLMLYYSLPLEDKDGPKKFGFKVFDTKMDLIWENQAEIKFNETFFAAKRFSIDNNGNAYIMGVEYKEKGGLFKQPIDREYHIFSYTDKGKSIRDYEISLDKKFISEITFGVNSNEDLICAGFYSENGTNSVKGTFYVAIDGETQKVKKSTYKELDEDFITESWTDREIAKAKKKEAKKGKAIEDYEYDLRDFVLHPNGGVTMLAEQYYVKVVTTTTTDANGRMTTKTTYHYYYNDIIIVDIDANGQFNWTTKIDKYQHTIDDGGFPSSYVLMLDKEKMHIVFNMTARYFFDKDEVKNMKGKEKRAYLSFFVTIDEKGKVENELLLNNSDAETVVIPKLCEQINDNQLLIFTQNRKFKKFGLLELK